MKSQIVKSISLLLIAILSCAGMLLLSSCSESNNGNNSPSDPYPTVHIATFGSLPRFSPDNEKIVFGGDGTNSGIWIYDLTTENLTQIVDAQHPHLYDYRWSQGSDKIAFGGAGATIDSTAGIYIVALDGSAPVRWNDTGNSPSWLPDGSGLIFEENNPQLSLFGVFKFTFADTMLALLTSTGVEPLISPTGESVAYRDPGSTQFIPLKVVPTAGGPSVTVADTCLHFTWTADGTNLIFDYVSYLIDEYGNLYQEQRISRVAASGSSDPVKIISNALQPAISENGVIVYQQINQDLSNGVFKVNLDGSDNTQVTLSGGSQPDISPDGMHVVYAKSDGIWLINL